MAQGGEFAFVLYAAAAAGGIITAQQNAVLAAVIILSMALTPLVIMIFTRLSAGQTPSADGLEPPQNLMGAALVIGFGRVGQVVSQLLLGHGHDISIIDRDVEMIEVARGFDFEVYYGDGTRLDILHAAGAGRARVAVVCVDRPDDATRITGLLRSEFPLLPVLVRSIDRINSLDLIKAGANLEVRETFESAMVLGRAALASLDTPPADIDKISARFRARDRERFRLQELGGIDAGHALFSGKPGPGERPV